MIAATLRSALIEAWTNRGSFWFQVVIMIVNDLAFVVYWFFFFQHVDDVRGWDFDKIMLLFSILATVAGLALGLLSNARHLGRLIGDGALDAVLPLPVNPLAFLLVRRVDTAIVGDLLFGPMLFVAFGEPTLERTALFVLGSLCGAAVFVSFLVALGSTTFFAGGRGEQGDLGFQAMLILATYPPEIFGGLTKLLVFTAVPAAFISGVPAQLVDDFSWAGAAVLVAVAGAFVAGAIALFDAGLRRYRSGALWTRA